MPSYSRPVGNVSLSNDTVTLDPSQYGIEEPYMIIIQDNMGSKYIYELSDVTLTTASPLVTFAFENEPGKIL